MLKLGVISADKYGRHTACVNYHFDIVISHWNGESNVITLPWDDYALRANIYLPIGSSMDRGIFQFSEQM